MSELAYICFVAVAVLVFIGLYCLMTMKNLIKLLIGAEIVAKGVSLALITAGVEKNNIMLAQSLAITFIVVEVALVAVALAIVIGIYKRKKSLDIRNLNNLRG
ncbi:MAG: hypothetical protein A2252_11225 [Elusimicrobia bacterium RIFOXYA2_FULL_39_19]|nr:MAG: hypothetical protein A2252_11225 [Elusimicrobia bacterium RIFOXYA2_FULL_39_19]